MIRLGLLVVLILLGSCKGRGVSDKPRAIVGISSVEYGASERLPKQCNPLIKTYWHQYAPFSEYACLKTGRKDAVAGCVIITLAQLINYHKRFDSGKSYFFGAIGSYLDSPEDNFPASDNKTYVSEFIKDISVSKKLSTYFESGYALYVYIDTIPEFLESIGYSAHMGSFNFAKAKRYISLGNPVILFAEIDDGRSHVWLIDGYKDYSEDSILYEPMLHVNWGWGVNYQNGVYEDGWNRLSQLGFSKYRKVDFNKRMTAIYVSRK